LTSTSFSFLIYRSLKIFACSYRNDIDHDLLRYALLTIIEQVLSYDTIVDQYRYTYTNDTRSNMCIQTYCFTSHDECRL